VITKKYCKTCTCFRGGDICHKCGSETREPARWWVEPELPPVELIRQLAKEVGYAIGIHGTQERDLDLIAAPWTDAAVGNRELMVHIAIGLGATISGLERKPNGRYATTIQMNGWFKPIDLSVCPAMPEYESLASMKADADRYQYLRNRDLNTIDQGGVFAGLTPDNVVLNGADLDRAIDQRLAGDCGS